MRITLLSWRDTTHPDGGGSERYLEEIARRLVARGDEVTICCAAHPASPPDETVDGVRFRRRGGRLTVYPRGLLFLVSARGRAQHVVVDVVNGLPFAARLVRRRGLVVLIHHLHREQWRMIYPGAWGTIGWFVESRVVPWLYRRHTFVAVSESTRDDLTALHVDRARVVVVRNGVGHPSVHVGRSVDPRICVLGRLVPHKRIEDGLRAVSDLRAEFPNLHLDVIGDGWWRDRLRERAAALGVTDLVTFHGRVIDARRDELLARSWFMLTTSVKEGWGIAIVEAAAVGTPTIAYRSAGGVTESIIDGRTGLLAADYDDLVRLARRLLRDDALRGRLSRAAGERAAHASWDETAEQFARVLLAEGTASLSGRRTG